MIAATILISPHAFGYDLILLAPVYILLANWLVPAEDAASPWRVPAGFDDRDQPRATAARVHGVEPVRAVFRAAPDRGSRGHPPAVLGHRDGDPPGVGAPASPPVRGAAAVAPAGRARRRDEAAPHGRPELRSAAQSPGHGTPANRVCMIVRCDDPIALFSERFARASAVCAEPDAMVLSTLSTRTAGRPDGTSC